MHTVLELLQKSTTFFTEKGIESPRYNAEALLAFVLQCERIQLYMQFDRPLADGEVDAYRDLVRKRSLREPLQYLLGTVSFFDLTLKVNESVLIPRPETELVVEKAIEYLKTIENPKVLDIGCGSGNISIAIAKHIPCAEVTALEMSEEALILARENADLNCINGSILFLRHNIMSDTLPPHSYDLIVSNPPYVSSADYQNLQAEIVQYEPRIAVTDDGDGFSFYSRIIEIARGHLNENAMLIFELGAGQAVRVSQLLEEGKFTDVTITEDYAGIPRIIQGIAR